MATAVTPAEIPADSATTPPTAEGTPAAGEAPAVEPTPVPTPTEAVAAADEAREAVAVLGHDSSQDMRLDASHTTQALGRSPSRPSLIADLRDGSYARMLLQAAV